MVMHSITAMETRCIISHKTRKARSQFLKSVFVLLHIQEEIQKRMPRTQERHARASAITKCHKRTRMFENKLCEVDSDELMRIIVPLTSYNSSNMVPIQDQIYQQRVASSYKIS